MSLAQLEVADCIQAYCLKKIGGIYFVISCLMPIASLQASLQIWQIINWMVRYNYRQSVCTMQS